MIGIRSERSMQRKNVNYSKWGYIFLIPFFSIYVVFQLIPLGMTFYNAFFENYMSGLTQVGPNFVGLDNFRHIFEGDLFRYLGNTLIIWIVGFVPQIIVALVLAVGFTDVRLRMKGIGFFKTVVYMPNLIMAAAFSMLFFTIFSNAGPVNSVLLQWGIIDEPIRFLAYTYTTRGLVGLMNFLMWFGNTSILLMAAIMGIDQCIIESAEIDGASSWMIFRKITLPLIRPLMLYVIMTSLIGGLQMFDVPQILTAGQGTPNRTTMTLIMYLNNHLYSKNYGLAGAVSIILLVITGIISWIVFKTMTEQPSKKERGQKR